jgi:hypothetical protein
LHNSFGISITNFVLGCRYINTFSNIEAEKGTDNSPRLKLFLRARTESGILKIFKIRQSAPTQCSVGIFGSHSKSFQVEKQENHRNVGFLEGIHSILVSLLYF